MHLLYFEISLLIRWRFPCQGDTLFLCGVFVSCRALYKKRFLIWLFYIIVNATSSQALATSGSAMIERKYYLVFIEGCYTTSKWIVRFWKVRYWAFTKLFEGLGGKETSLFFAFQGKIRLFLRRVCSVVCNKKYRHWFCVVIGIR